MAAFTTLAIIGGVSAGIQAWQAHKAGQAQKKAGAAQADASESQAQLAEFNADVADLQAADATTRGTEEENRFRTQVRGAIGAQRAGFAAGNIDVGFGSALDVQADASYLGELDALQIRTNAAREAWGYKVQSTDYRKRAEIARKEGANAIAIGNEGAKQGNLNAATTLLGAGTSLLQARYGFGRSSAA